MIGFAKGGFGGMVALLTPIFALVLPVASAIGVLLPMLMVGDVFAVFFQPAMQRDLPPKVPGIVCQWASLREAQRGTTQRPARGSLSDAKESNFRTSQPPGVPRG
jgi:hypothetical protein